MPEEQAGWSDAKKWFLGVVGSLIVALVGFALMREGGLLNPSPTPAPKPVPAAAVSISAFELPFPLTNKTNHMVTFTIANEGTAVARGCEMRGDVTLALGKQFSVPPNSSTVVDDWGVTTYGRKSDTVLTAWVQCENANSKAVTRKALIIDLGNG
jgi:hypothetical protein